MVKVLVLMPKFGSRTRTRRRARSFWITSCHWNACRILFVLLRAHSTTVKSNRSRTVLFWSVFGSIFRTWINSNEILIVIAKYFASHQIREKSISYTIQNPRYTGLHIIFQTDIVSQILRYKQVIMIIGGGLMF